MLSPLSMLFSKLSALTFFALAFVVPVVGPAAAASLAATCVPLSSASSA
jgi:hypothetical protein